MCSLLGIFCALLKQSNCRVSRSLPPRFITDRIQLTAVFRTAGMPGVCMHRVLRLFVGLMILMGIASGVQAAEFIANGGFETGDLTGWSYSANVFVAEEWFSVEPPEGDFMAVMSPGGFFDSGLWQEVSGFDPSEYSQVTVGFEYNFRSVDWFPGLDFGTDYLEVAANGFTLLHIDLDDAFGSGSQPDWMEFSETYPITEVIGPLEFRFYLENMGSGDEGQNTVAYIDNVSVQATQIPLPGAALKLPCALPQSETRLCKGLKS